MLKRKETYQLITPLLVFPSILKIMEKIILDFSFSLFQILTNQKKEETGNFKISLDEVHFALSLPLSLSHSFSLSVFLSCSPMSIWHPYLNIRLFHFLEAIHIIGTSQVDSSLFYDAYAPLFSLEFHKATFITDTHSLGKITPPLRISLFNVVVFVFVCRLILMYLLLLCICHIAIQYILSQSDGFLMVSLLPVKSSVVIYNNYGRFIIFYRLHDDVV